MGETLQTDIAVIGAGTAGLTAFHEIRRGGRTALLVDHGPLGTTCARVGCMPSKAVLHAAHKWSVLRELLGAQAATASGIANDLWRQALTTRDTLFVRVYARRDDGVLLGASMLAEPEPPAVLHEAAVLAIARMQADGWSYIRS